MKKLVKEILVLRPPHTEPHMRVRVCELRVSPELNIENGAKSSKARALFGKIYVQGTKKSQTRKLAGSVWGSH